MPAKVSPKTITDAAPTAAPEETPTTPGSASGLPKTPCMSAPAVASEAPAITAVSTRGNRTCQSVFSPCGWLGHRPEVEAQLVQHRAEHLGRGYVELAAPGREEHRGEQPHRQEAEQAHPAEQPAGGGPRRRGGRRRSVRHDTASGA